MSTYLSVQEDIGSRVGDPELDTYKQRTKDHFLRAIATLIREGKFDKQDIPGFVKAKIDVDFSDAGDTEDLNGLSIFRILNFFMPPGTDKDVIITVRDTAELNRQSAIETLQPTDNDLFIYQIGNALYGVTGTGTPVFILGTTACIMEYIEDIDDNAWTDSTDLQDATDFQLTYTFMRTAIDLATETLLNEVNT
ncbi:MAG: hypothetical protein V3W20_09250 [Candidatus Neomarinimicrobiota bacterium]